MNMRLWLWQQEVRSFKEELMIGKTISHYRIVEKLGEGGMGVVYKAEDTKLKRTVALKFLPPEFTRDPAARERFVHEAQAAAALDHPDICTIYEIDEAENHAFIAMAYIDGERLTDKIERGPLKLEEALEIAVHIAQGLQAAHEKGIVHRDIKSANVMLTISGQLKVMDFGLAKLPGRTMVTREGTTLGTAGYMSPEQARGENADSLTDIWSLGVVLYEMLTGRLPFRGEYEQALIYQILNGAPDPITSLRTGVPMDLERIVTKCLEKNPGERYQTAVDLLADLRHLQRTLGIESQAKQSVTPMQQRPFRRIRWWYWVAPSLLLVAIIAIILIRMPARETKRDMKSIAVIPFKNMSDSKEDEYFSDGIAEDIRAQLSKIADLKVISQQSVMQYKNSGKSIKDIGRELGVATILEGSVRRSGGQVRIVAQLIDAVGEGHIWADTYDEEMTNIFAIQSDVAQKIAVALEAKLTPIENEMIAKKPTDNPAAYDYYLKGRDYYGRYNKQANENAIKLFRKALEFDPNYAFAYAGLGDAYGQKRLKFGFALGWADSSIAMSKKALSLDPRMPEAFKSLGLGYSAKGLLQNSTEAYLKAVELDPKYAGSMANIGFNYIARGKLDSAFYWFRKSELHRYLLAWDYVGYGVVYDIICDTAQAERWFKRALDNQPDFTIAQATLSSSYLSRSNYRLALESAQNVLLNDPENLIALSYAATARLFSGDYAEARHYYERVSELSSNRMLDWTYRSITTDLGFLLWKSGERDRARELFREGMRENNELLRQGSERYVVSYDNAAISAIQGNRDEAYLWLQRAIDAGWRDYRLGPNDPLFENIRSEERFKHMMEDVKAKVDEQRILVEKMEKQ